MDDTMAVCMLESIRDLGTKPECLVERRNCAAYHLAQLGSIDVLHRDERDASLFAHLVDRADVRVIESRRVACLGDEASVCRPTGRPHANCLDRHLPVEDGVAGLVYLAHSAGRDKARQLVRAKLCSNCQAGGRFAVAGSIEVQ